MKTLLLLLFWKAAFIGVVWICAFIGVGFILLILFCVYSHGAVEQSPDNFSEPYEEDEEDTN